MEYFVKKIVIVCFFAAMALIALSCSGQQTQKELNKKKNDFGVNDSLEQQIKMIKEEYSNINVNISKFKVIQKDIHGESSEGGELKAYVDSDKLRKAIATYYGETGKSTREYYFENREIIFIYEREDRYESPIYQGKSKIKSIQENRYYFFNQKLIRWIGNDGKIVDQKEYASKEIDLFYDLKTIYSILSVHLPKRDPA